MVRLRAPQRAAIELVAKRFSASWEAADAASADAWLTIAGERVAVEVTTLEPSLAEPAKPPRLRFDRVALRLVRQLRAGLSEIMPDGQAAVVTVTAPIRLPARTAAALESRIRDGLDHPSGSVEKTGEVCGNQVRMRLVRGLSRRMPKLIGFVHNPDPGPEPLFALTESLLRCVGAAADNPAAERFADDRWLIVVVEDALWPVETVRQIYAEIAPSTGFQKALAVVGGRRVELLS